MHDEDNAIGLAVVNPNHYGWHMYGDKRLFDKVDASNKIMVIVAVQLSADEIFEAWTTQKTPSIESYKALDCAPTLETARATTQELAPLFTFENKP